MNFTTHLKTGLVIAAMALVSGSAKAQMADVGAGQKRAAVCFACHGQNGVSKAPGVPHLAGQDRVYLERSLTAYKGGQVRQDPTMTSMAKPLSDRDIANIAAYFSGLPRREK